MFRINSSVSVHRIDNCDCNASIYKVSSSSLYVKSCVPQTKTLSCGSMSKYPELPLASAPPIPWYYYSYPSEVILKAHTVLHATWYKLNYSYQKQFLEFYLRSYNNNDLE